MGNDGSGAQESSNRSNGKLPKSIKVALDGFSMKMAKTKSFHSKINSNRLI